MGTLRDHWPFMLIPIAVTVIGGLISSSFMVAPAVRSMIQHFTAGVVFAAIAGEVIPDVIDRRAPIATVVGFTFGVCLMFGISRATEALEESGIARDSTAYGGPSASSPSRASSERTPWGLVVAVGIDGLVDGLVIGIGFTIGSTLGTLVTVALSLEMFFLGLATAATLRATGSPPRKAMVITAAAAAMIAFGVLLGVTAFSGLPNAGLAGVLSFGCAALLYLVTEELLKEAHTVAETRRMSVLFFGGFLILLTVEMSL